MADNLLQIINLLLWWAHFHSSEFSKLTQLFKAYGFIKSQVKKAWIKKHMSEWTNEWVNEKERYTDINLVVSAWHPVYSYFLYLAWVPH